METLTKSINSNIILSTYYCCDFEQNLLTNQCKISLRNKNNVVSSKNKIKFFIMEPTIKVLKMIAMGLVYGVAFRLSTAIWNL